MKTSLTLIFLLSFVNIFSQTKVLSLENNTGIIEDESGSVIRWENQIEGYGDALQAISALGGDKLYETYPGKVNVGFSKDGSFLELEGSNAYFLDNSFSVFYVGKVGNVRKVATLLGNLAIDGDWDHCSGLRFVRKSNGDLAFQYGRPVYKHIVLNNLPENEFFFFGFSMDASGNYTYFDNSSSIIKSGSIVGEIYHNNQDHKLNLHGMIDTAYTYDHTEVVEVAIFDNKMSTADFENQYNILSSEYPELIAAEFAVSEVLPTVRTNLSVASPITISFNQAIDSSSIYPKIYINKTDIETQGNWALSAANTLTFTPIENWPYNALVTVQIDQRLNSTNGASIDVSKGASYNFLVETDNDFGVAENIEIASIGTVDFPQAGHNLPLKLTLPTNRTKKMPIHFWIHGGGWSGGTAAASSASYSPHGEYLAENLGIATLGVAYRCKGSSGNFAYAMADIKMAYEWAMENAKVYNFDTTKIFFSGGSAGTPLASLSAQQLDGVIGFIGFNGTYDFVNDKGCWGSGNGFKQEVPSAKANSAIFNLRTNPPATILMHGEDDTTIPYSQSTLFADAVNAAGGDARAIIYPGEVHAFFNLGKPAYEDVLIEMANFISEVLKDNNKETGMNKIENKEHTLLAYPNPVTAGNTLHVLLNPNFNEKTVNIQVLNLLGQVLLNTSRDSYFGSNKISVGVNDLNRGHYILKTTAAQASDSLGFTIQ